jgi:predicted GIY-YIG superfamily endonuclease
MLYSLVDGYRRIGVNYCLHLQGRRVRPEPVAMKRENRVKGKTRKDKKNKIRKKRKVLEQEIFVP